MFSFFSGSPSFVRAFFLHSFIPFCLAFTWSLLSAATTVVIQHLQEPTPSVNAPDDAVDRYHSRLWRSQRNMYLAALAFCLWWSLFEITKLVRFQTESAKQPAVLKFPPAKCPRKPSNTQTISEPLVAKLTTTDCTSCICSPCSCS